MFVGLDDPKMQTICKYLYCFTFLRGTCDSICFWIIDKHAREIVHSFFTLTTLSDRAPSLDDYFSAMHCHAPEIVAVHEEKSIDQENSVAINLTSVQLDRIYGIEKT